jgi:hypothetical protein
MGDLTALQTLDPLFWQSLVGLPDSNGHLFALRMHLQCMLCPSGKAL